MAPTDALVLIEGETGTGKELIAHMLHANSPRANAPFLPVDCASLAPSLIESELFGALRGAYTGATATASACLRRPTEARSFWTKSAKST